MRQQEFTQMIDAEQNLDFFRRVRSIGCNDAQLVFDFNKQKNIDPAVIKVICIAQRFAMLDNKKVIFKGIPEDTKKLLDTKTNVAVAF